MKDIPFNNQQKGTLPQLTQIESKINELLFHDFGAIQQENLDLFQSIDLKTINEISLLIQNNANLKAKLVIDLSLRDTMTNTFVEAIESNKKNFHVKFASCEKDYKRVTLDEIALRDPHHFRAIQQFLQSALNRGWNVTIKPSDCRALDCYDPENIRLDVSW